MALSREIFLTFFGFLKKEPLRGRAFGDYTPGSGASNILLFFRHAKYFILYQGAKFGGVFFRFIQSGGVDFF